MPPKFALFLGILFVIFMYGVVERRRAINVSSALFWPLLLYLIASSRAAGLWLYVLGFPLPSGGDTEGSIVDRMVYFILCLIGLYVLSRRNIEWGAIFRENRWLIVLFLFMFLSVSWSNYPWVSFKRLVKSFTTIVLVLVVLTENDPFTAIDAILRRGAYLVVPFSIIVIKYFRDIGVEYDWSGTGVSWKGLTTSKNMLGQVAMTSALCFAWSIARNWGKGRSWTKFDYLYLAMSLYLLKGSDSAVSKTSLSVFALGLFLLIICSCSKGRPVIASRVLTVLCMSILGLLGILVLHTISPFPENSILGAVIRGLGRDMTLSGRTDIWTDVLKIASRNPLFGVGFGGFWIGRAANIPWSEKLSWVLSEGHNGYFDVYLQIGLIGVILLLAVVVSARRRIIQSFVEHFEYGSFRITFLVIILFVNITESTFLRGEHLMWFLLLLSVLTVPLVTRHSVRAADVGALDASIPNGGA